jgi:hypothetical protein
VYEDSEMVYLVLEYIDGKTLLSALEEEGAFDEA